MKDRTLLMIPGPIEFEPAVLAALGAPTTSHVARILSRHLGKRWRRRARCFSPMMVSRLCWRDRVRWRWIPLWPTDRAGR